MQDDAQFWRHVEDALPRARRIARALTADPVTATEITRQALESLASQPPADLAIDLADTMVLFLKQLVATWRLMGHAQPSATMELSEELRRLNAFLQSLAPDVRCVYVLHQLEQFGVDEIVDIAMLHRSAVLRLIDEYDV